MGACVEVVSPVRVAWSAACAPVSAGGGSEPGAVKSHWMCAVCGERPAETDWGGRVPVREVVSKNFTEMDRFADPRGRVMCEPCGWAFTDEQWIRGGVYVEAPAGGGGTAGPQAGVGVAGRVGVEVSWEHVAGVLREPLSGGVAVAVPIRGRKHVLPWMRWGCVSIDGHTFEWGVSESVVHRAVWEVLAAGLNVGVLLDPSSPVVLPDALASVEGLQAWGVVSRWRGTPIVMVSARLFRKQFSR